MARRPQARRAARHRRGLRRHPGAGRAPRPSSSGTTSASPRPRSATTWRCWRRRATSPSRTPAPGGSPPTRATGSSSTGSSTVKPLSPRRAARDPDLPRRRRRPRRRRHAHGAAARAAHPAGRGRAVPLADPLDGPARRARAAGDQPGAAGPDHRHRPGRAAHRRLPGDGRTRPCSATCGPGSTRRRRSSLSAVRDRGRDLAGVVRAGATGRSWPPSLADAARDARRAARGAARRRRHGQPRPLRSGLRPAVRAGARGARGAGASCCDCSARRPARPTLTVRIGHENADVGPDRDVRRHRRLRSGRATRWQLGVVGPTRMDYPGTMAAVGRRGALRRPDPGGNTRE